MSQKPTLYYFRLSPASKSVLLTIKRLGLDFDFNHVDTRLGEQFRPEFMQLNPQHTVPILRDGDQTILDGSAISTYLVHRYGAEAFATLAPTDPIGRAKVEQLQHFSDSKLFNLFYKMMMHIGAGANALLEADVTGTLEALDILESYLVRGGNSFVCGGPNVTVADFSCVSTGSALMTLMMDTEGREERYPQIHEWIKRIGGLLPGDFEEIVLKTNAEVREALVAAKSRQ